MKRLPVKTWIDQRMVDPNLHEYRTQPNEVFAYHKTNNIMQKANIELLDKEQKLVEPSKWFAYLDLSYAHTENSNYDSVSVSKKRLVTDGIQTFSTPSTVEYDKSFKRSRWPPCYF